MCETCSGDDSNNGSHPPTKIPAEWAAATTERVRGRKKLHLLHFIAAERNENTAYAWTRESVTSSSLFNILSSGSLSWVAVNRWYWIHSIHLPETEETVYSNQLDLNNCLLKMSQANLSPTAADQRFRWVAPLIPRYFPPNRGSNDIFFLLNYNKIVSHG